MDKIIVIVGTNHEFQWSDKCRSNDEIEKFRNYLSVLVKKHSIHAIAEEMNKEVLNENSQDESIPFQVAQSFNIAHQYSDPTIDEQSELGIMNEGTIEYYGQYRNNWSREEIQERIEKEYRKREAVWLARIKTLNKWPLLFICGSEHVTPFCNKLLKSGFIVNIEANSWTA